MIMKKNEVAQILCISKMVVMGSTYVEMFHLNYLSQSKKTAIFFTLHIEYSIDFKMIVLESDFYVR